MEFRDHRDTLRRLPGFPSRKATEELARNLERLISFRGASGGQLDPSLHKWLTDLPRATARKLAEIGLVDGTVVAVSVPLTEHRKDFAEALRAKGVTEKHVELVTTRLDRILEGCGFHYWTDLTPGRVLRYLKDLRSDKKSDDGKVEKGISPQTFNFYVQAIKQFCNWAVKERRIDHSPVSSLTGINVKTDRRRDRRALEHQELGRLIEVTQKGDDRFGMSGQERALLYRLASETGLRAGETRTTTFADYGAAIEGTPDLDLPDPKTVPVEVPVLVEETKNGCTMGMLLCPRGWRDQVARPVATGGDPRIGG